MGRNEGFTEQDIQNLSGVEQRLTSILRTTRKIKGEWIEVNREMDANRRKLTMPIFRMKPWEFYVVMGGIGAVSGMIGAAISWVVLTL